MNQYEAICCVHVKRYCKYSNKFSIPWLSWLPSLVTDSKNTKRIVKVKDLMPSFFVDHKNLNAQY